MALAFLILSTAALNAQPAPGDAFARWRLYDAAAARMSYLNRPSLYLQNGIALSPDIEFSDGTIEFDVAVHGHAGFAGVVFRAASDDDYELIYLRTHRSRAWDALQYSPVFRHNEAWQLYTGKGYNGVAEIPANRWVHVRVVVDGLAARVFVDNAPEPQLVVTDLKRPWAPGKVGLWGRSGAANFSNFRVSPVSRPAPVPAPIARREGVVEKWSISPPFAAQAVEGDRLPANLTWDRVTAEASGIVNIGRYRTLVDEDRSTVFAKAIVRAESGRRVKLWFGYSDDVTIFLDGVPVFAGQAGYLSRDGSYLGTLTLDGDAVYLNLAAGNHEVIFAVTEAFGGWGLAARFESSAQLTLE